VGLGQRRSGRKLEVGEPLSPVETMAAGQTEGGRRILWWLITEVLVLLVLLITLVPWAHSDGYFWSTIAVFAVSLVFAAVVLPATAVYWLSSEAEAEH
jgi:membrane protein YdbS with pleckstrin-like domain